MPVNYSSGWLVDLLSANGHQVWRSCLFLFRIASPVGIEQHASHVFWHPIHPFCQPILVRISRDCRFLIYSFCLKTTYSSAVSTNSFNAAASLRHILKINSSGLTSCAPTATISRNDFFWKVVWYLIWYYLTLWLILLTECKFNAEAGAKFMVIWRNGRTIRERFRRTSSKEKLTELTFVWKERWFSVLSKNEKLKSIKIEVFVHKGFPEKTMFCFW